MLTPAGEDRFTETQISALRAAFAGIQLVNPGSPAFAALQEAIAALPDALLGQLRGAGIKWISYLASRELVANREPRLVPACGGAETPVTKNGRRYLYCWDANQTETYPGNHVYVDLGTDLPLTPQEFDEIFCK